MILRLCTPFFLCVYFFIIRKETNIFHGSLQPKQSTHYKDVFNDMKSRYKDNTTSGRLHYFGLTLISAWISNHMLNKVWDEITYPYLNFNGATVEV